MSCRSLAVGIFTTSCCCTSSPFFQALGVVFAELYLWSGCIKWQALLDGKMFHRLTSSKMFLTNRLYFVKNINKMWERQCTYFVNHTPSLYLRTRTLYLRTRKKKKKSERREREAREGRGWGLWAKRARRRRRRIGPQPLPSQVFCFALESSSLAILSTSLLTQANQGC